MWSILEVNATLNFILAIFRAKHMTTYVNLDMNAGNKILFSSLEKVIKFKSCRQIGSPAVWDTM